MQKSRCRLMDYSNLPTTPRMVQFLSRPGSYEFVTTQFRTQAGNAITRVPDCVQSAVDPVDLSPHSMPSQADGIPELSVNDPLRLQITSTFIAVRNWKGTRWNDVISFGNTGRGVIWPEFRNNLFTDDQAYLYGILMPRLNKQAVCWFRVKDCRASVF